MKIFSAEILLANFERLVQKSLYEMLCRSGYKVDTANSKEETLAFLEEKNFRVILTDLHGANDIAMIKEIKEKSENAEIIVIAARDTVELTAGTVKTGVFDYLIRPVKDEKILSTIEKALDSPKPAAAAEKKTPILRKLFHPEDSFYGLIGSSERSKSIYSIIERISNSNATILLQGESGTGKRMIAHAIHKSDRKRRHKAFIEVSCGALPREIIESELFGHTKGAFTGAIADRKGRFELAHGGTLLLDDIDSLPLDLQVKLLRVLQQKEFERVGDHKTMKVDVRVIATTNQDIAKSVVEKKFREDLYYRINVISLHVPPLKERKDDLPLLVEHFIKFYAKENHKKISGISEEARQVLMNYDWPGNIRELENIIERAIILDTDSAIERDDLPEIIHYCKPAESAAIIQNIQATLKEALHEPEKVHILRILNEVGWNKKKAAKKLGVNRTTLYNKLRKHNIVIQETKD